MGVKSEGKKAWVCSAVCLILVLSSVNAFAWDQGRDSGHDRDRGRDMDSHRDKGREVVVVGHNRYYYHDGRFYRPGLFGFEIALFAPPIGAVVASIPVGRRTVLVGGASYYYYDNVYYKPVPSGYAVVPAPAVVSVPAVVAQPAVAPYSAAPEAVTINVPNSNGSYSPVTLIRRGNGYVGPQGEYYPEHPTVEQLRTLYGR